MEKQFIQIQIALFFKSDFTGPFESVSLKIKELFGNDLNSQIIGIPNDAPAEIPRVTINSQLVNINFAKNRVDFFSKNQNFFTENVEKIFELLNSFSISIGRVGFVSNYFLESSEKKMKSIFKEDNVQIKNPKDINVRINEVIDIGSFKFNDSQAYATGSVKDTSGNEIKGVILTKDTNSLQEELAKNLFSKEKLITIYNKIINLEDRVNL